MGDWAAGQILPDIPRFYTALAEWLSCLLCMRELVRRYSGWKFWGIAGAAFLVQSVFLVLTGGLDGPVWLMCMAAAVFLMFCFLRISCGSSSLDVGYVCVKAFVLAEFMASLEWQLHCFFYYGMGYESSWTGLLLLLAVYGGTCLVARGISSRYISGTERMDTTGRELLFAAVIGLSVFLMSNIGFVYSQTPFSGKYASDIFNVRTLIDLGGLAILVAYHIQRLHLRAQHDLESMEMILHNQYTQYQQSQETLDLINYKYHDLKHHIIALRAEENKEKRNAYLDQMEDEIRNYEAQNKTGNQVLDTLLTAKSLYCMREKIALTYVVDGARLDFMDVMDICSIFGNALDNAIECEKKIPETEKRMIHVSMFVQQTFLIIRFENYCEGELDFEQNLPVTTKKQAEFHGYGLKSLRHTVHKYGGEVDIDVEDQWFRLKILIPL
ncbi:ATP-binding protein [Lachnospiraceae bacterium]|nr:sensor histidine kinase [uncultured Schaedlerella sp.]NBI58441.1 ATP-binding protein [Lachnospiraceae bacterium]